MEDHEPAGGHMVRVVLNLSTVEDSDNLDNKGGGKRYDGATQIWINSESREDQALPYQEGRKGFEERRIWWEDLNWSMDGII